MVTIANTVLGTLEGRVVHWDRIIVGLVGKLAEHVRRNKTNRINPYLFHLYHHKEVLDNMEQVQYDTGVGILKYDFTNEIKKDSEEGRRSKALSIHKRNEGSRWIRHHEESYQIWK